MFGLFKQKAETARDGVVDELLQRIEDCKLSSPSETKLVAYPLFDAIAKAVQTQWSKEHVANYRGQLEEGQSHEKFIYNAVIKTVAHRLESGKHHMFRGVLDDEGRLYLDLFQHALATMVLKGEYSKEWADETLRAPLLKAIKELG